MNFSKIRKPIRVELGNWTVWSLSDGYCNLDVRLLFNKDTETLKKVFSKADAELSDEFMASFQVNNYLIDTKEHLILVDAGCGSFVGPYSGHLCDQIQEAGFCADDITHILITHLHADHMGGLINKDGERSFPNALLYVPAIDAAFWRDSTQKNRVLGFLHYVFELAKKALEPYEKDKKLRLIQSGDPILPGIEAIKAYGHTLGHMAYYFSSKDQELIMFGDIVHNVRIQLENIDWEVSVDIDPKQAVISRKTILKKISEKNMLVAGGHLPGSGLGHISLEGNSFVWKSYKEH